MCPSWPMDTCQVTKGYMTTLGMGASLVTIAHVIELAYRNILTCLWDKSCGHFGCEDLMWLKSAKVYLKVKYFHIST